MKEDPRIRLINNEKNRRILYSKSIAALYANGKYIIELDQDDMFLTDDAFNILYNEAEKNNLDLIQFQDFSLNSFNISYNIEVGKSQLIIHHKDTYLKQPNIKYEMFKDYHFVLWGLLIKSDIYKKAINILWPIIINYKIIHFEDYTITFIIVSLVNNFKFLNNYFIIHLFNKYSIKDSSDFTVFDVSVLLFVNSMIEYHIKYNSEDIKMLINLLSSFKLVNRLKKNKPILFRFVYGKFFNYLSYKDKKNFTNQFNLSEFKIWNTYELFMNETEYNSIFFYQNLINNDNNKKIKSNSVNPKFSIIIYCEKYNFIKVTINSILMQDFDNVETILIYDNIEENELNLIKELIKEYTNIKLIINKRKGVISSYFTGILESKGEYILTIKPGYTLSKRTILNEIVKNIDDNLDILEFNLLINDNEIIRNDSLYLYKCSHFKSEINIDSFLFNQNYKKIDLEKELIINKLIKSNVYKRIINKYKYFFIDNKIYNYFDELILFLFKKEKIEIKHINNFIIIKNSKIIKSFDLYPEINNEKQLSEDSIFYINFLFDNIQIMKKLQKK